VGNVRLRFICFSQPGAMQQSSAAKARRALTGESAFFAAAALAAGKDCARLLECEQEIESRQHLWERLGTGTNNNLKTASDFDLDLNLG
jgi:hypothetical protein